MLESMKNLFCSILNLLLIVICHLFLSLCKVVSVEATETKQKHHWNGKTLKLVHVVGIINSLLLNKKFHQIVILFCRRSSCSCNTFYENIPLRLVFTEFKTNCDFECLSKIQQTSCSRKLERF